MKQILKQIHLSSFFFVDDVLIDKKSYGLKF